MLCLRSGLAQGSMAFEIRQVAPVHLQTDRQLWTISSAAIEISWPSAVCDRCLFWLSGGDLAATKRLGREE